MSKFSSPCALWGLTSEGFSSSGDGTAVVAVWDPCLARWWGSIDSAKLSLGGDVEVEEMVHLGGIFWTWGLATCHAPLLPQTPLPLRSFLLHGGDRWHANWQSTFAYSVVSGDRREFITMRCKGVRYRHWLEKRKQLCEPCAQCLSCNGFGGAVGQKCCIFCSAPQTWGIKWTMQWDLFQHGNALLVHVYFTVPFGAQFEQCNSCLRSVLVLPLLLLPLLLWVKLLLPVTVPKFPC